MTTTTANIKVLITTTVCGKPVRKMPKSTKDDREMSELYKALYKKFPGLKDQCSDVRIVMSD